MPGPQASSPDLPALHAWTHRPEALGGTDPIEIEVTGGGILSHFPRHPVWATHIAEAATEWPGGVVVLEAANFAVAGTPTTDSSNNYSSQTFLRFTTAASSYAAAANLVVVDPAAIGLLDDHAYSIVFQYRLGAGNTVSLGWTHHGDTPAVVADSLPGSGGANNWFSMGLIATTVGVAKVRHGNDIELRAYHASSATQIDLDLIMFIPNDYQDGSPPLNTDPAVFDTYARIPDTGQKSSTTSIEFPDDTHFNGQCISDTQTVNSILDPAFRWSTTTWSSGYQAFPQGSGETDAFAWEAGHGRHLYVTARLQGEAGSDDDAFSSAGAVAYGSNGMPHASAVLFNNSWQLVYLGPISPSHEIGHLAGWVIAADPGGNEAPFTADGETTIADVRIGTMFQVTCLYDPQST